VAAAREEARAEVEAEKVSQTSCWRHVLLQLASVW
jgi:hypothetical protein